MPYAILGGAQLAVGAAAIFARYAMGGAGPVAVAASRLCIAAVILAIVAGVRGAQRPVTARENRVLAFAGFALAIHFAAWLWSLEYTSVAVSTLLVTTTPVWTAAYDALTGKRRLSARALAAFAAGGAGLLMVVGLDRTPPPQAGHSAEGIALALLGALAIAAYLILVRNARTTLRATRAIVTRTYGWAAVFLTAAALCVHQTPPRISDTAAWGGILAMALVSQLLGHTAINASLRWFTPSAISFATLLEPVFAAVLAFALFHEPVPPLAIVGGLILLGAIAVVLREERLDDWTVPDG